MLRASTPAAWCAAEKSKVIFTIGEKEFHAVFIGLFEKVG